MSQTTRNLGLPLIAAGQAQKHVTHNEALTLVDALLHLACLDKDLAAPPANPAEGDRYLVTTATPGGAWAGLSGQMVRFADGVWVGAEPRPGWFAYLVDEAEIYVFDGRAWIGLRGAATALQNVPRLGLGTAADADNPFSAKLNKALWTARTRAEGGSGDLRYTLNKEGAGNVLSLLLQSGFAGRAEIGLTGDDDLHVKVSANGTAFVEALRVAAATGFVGLAGTAAPRSALDFGLGVATGAGNDYAKAQHLLCGGGTVTWGGVGNRLKWTLRFIALPCAQPTAATGFIEVPQPTAPIPASQCWDGNARAADASGVVLNVWEALYAVHTPGGLHTDVSLRIVSYQKSFSAPSNWLLVAAVNGEDGSLRLGSGVILKAGGRWTAGSDAQYAPLLPSTDNAVSLGGPASRYATLYAATGAINTSDGREKRDRAGAPLADDWRVSPLTAAETAAAAEIAGEIGVFRFADAVGTKGPAARLHAGLTVQRVVAILAAHGLDPFAYGFVCHDGWAARPPGPAPDAPDGPLPVQAPDPGRPAGERYGFREGELMLFLARGLDARLTALERRGA